ncbi:MAG: hypothetical protein P8K08_17570 [Fuerstiella sp.]|nr:hypothetical protein [Fuerstiella sp.]
MFRTGYILTPKADLFWFLALPFLATGAALASQQWLTGVALLTIGLWVTAPHQFASWLRTYGIPEERRFWRDRLYFGPLLIFLMCLAGFSWAPITTAMLVILWDHQHSIMQQHGFARIYDFKGSTGAPSTGRFDLILGWVLFCNMLVTSPMFMWPLIRELYRLRIAITPETVRLIASTSWFIVAVYSAIYAAHLVWSVARGYRLNPVKYLFITSSYFLWYFCAWHASNVLVWGIAHKIMHGAQYTIMVYWYLRRQTQTANSESRFAARLVRPGNVTLFVLGGLFYAILVHTLTGGQIGAFIFGWLNYPTLYEAIPALGLAEWTPGEGYAFVSLAVLNTLGMTHYYFDSFIWKVSDRRIQEGLT